MQPNSFPTVTPPPNQEGYDFILNGPAKQKKSLLPGSSGSKQQRIIIVVVVITFLIIAAWLFFWFLGRAGGAQRGQLLEIAQTETELIRISDLVNKDAKATDTKSFSLNTKYSMTTALNETTARLSKLGTKTNAKNLTLKRNPQDDRKLAAAKIGNDFDEIGIEMIEQKLSTYRALLKNSYDISTNEVDKALFIKHSKTTELLLKAP